MLLGIDSVSRRWTLACGVGGFTWSFLHQHHHQYRSSFNLPTHNSIHLFFKMKLPTTTLPFLSLTFYLALASCQPQDFTNLPPVAPGIFNASTRMTINSTAALAYAALIDFPSYPAWNPFVRFAAVVSPTNITLPCQQPAEGLNLFLRVQIPPLPLPVDAETPDNPLATQLSYEEITAVQPELGRLAWRFFPDTPGVLQAERWQAVSDLGEGMVLYESREVFRGVGAVAVKEALGEGLQAAFVSQGLGLKMLLEGMSAM
jgi:hypothetical protein